MKIKGQKDVELVLKTDRVKQKRQIEWKMTKAKMDTIRHDANRMPIKTIN